MSFEVYYSAVKQCRYHGNDLTLVMLSRMLKMVICVIHPNYLWLSNLDVNVRDANVVLCIDESEVFTGTGQLVRVHSLSLVVVVVTECLLINGKCF